MIFRKVLGFFLLLGTLLSRVWAAPLPMIEDRGIMLLIVDNTMAAPLATELARLEQDLVGDGWQVIRKDVPRTHANFDPGVWYDPNNPAHKTRLESDPEIHTIRSWIKSQYTANPTRVKSVFIFGHVPIANSGWFNPDGHAAIGHPAGTDAFYADMDLPWTDTFGASIGNYKPGDGNFDQGTFRPELEYGRVDLWNMTEFSLSETELLRQYLNKDHSYRHNIVRTRDTHAAFENNLPAGSYAGGVYPRAMLTLFASNIVDCYKGDSTRLSDTSKTQSFRWAFSGAGESKMSLTSALIQEHDPKINFFWMYGSYTWDWRHTQKTNPNPVLINGRSMLAGKTYGLAAFWGRTLVIGGLNMGKTLGSLIPETLSSGVLPQTFSLSGDPSLRAHPVTPVSNVSATRNSSGVLISWTRPADGNIVGYKVYRAASEKGPFQSLTPGFLTATQFQDNTAPSETVVYMVRSVVDQATPQGNYYNPSQGVFRQVPPAHLLLGDYNLDCVVNDADHALYKATWGKAVTPYSGADGNGNGSVDSGDYVVWRENKGKIGVNCFISGDYNRDCMVTDADHVVYKATWGNTVTPHSGADGNGSGNIESGDYIVWRENKGRMAGNCPAGTSMPLSEPVEEVAPVSNTMANKTAFNPLRSEQGTYTVVLERSEHLLARIQDRRGQEVRVIMNRDLPAGENLLSWDGRDSTGEVVAAGIYTVHIQKSKPERIKFVVVK